LIRVLTAFYHLSHSTSSKFILFKILKWEGNHVSADAPRLYFKERKRCIGEAMDNHQMKLRKWPANQQGVSGAGALRLWV
jgi:hypothetical protein